MHAIDQAQIEISLCHENSLGGSRHRQTETLDGGAARLGVPGGVWLKMERNSEAAPPALT